MKKNYPLLRTLMGFLINIEYTRTKLLLLTVVTLFGVSSAFAQFPGNDNAPGVGKTFTVPANVTHVNAAAWGAGGGGGGSDSNGDGGNGGGGGGAASSQIAVANGNIFTYSLTAGGAGGAAAAGKGGDGGTTTITAITPATNMTGGGGTGGLGNRANLSTGNSEGGVASGGTNSIGAVGIRAANNGNSGKGGNSGTAFGIFGTGGAGLQNNNGNPGVQPGGGGSGGERRANPGGSDFAGGAGAPGRVMFDYITVSGVTPSPVCVGATITITGNYLSGLGTTTVTVNGTACTSVTVVNATTITAVVGVGTTTGVVDINNNGRRNNGQSITVNALPTITLTSAVGTNSQSRCINTALTDITYSITGGGVTGASVTGLPAGVTSGFAAGVLTINGAPTASGSYTYTVTTTGGSCVSTTTGTITVSALPNISLTSAAGTSNQSICRGTAITNITYSIGGSALGVTLTGLLPAGVTGSLVGTTYTLSGTPTANGTFNYTLTTTGGSCSGATINGTITVNALPANPGNPTSNSPQCNPAGVTLTRVGTPPVGETWYWQTIALGTSTTNSGATFNVTTSATYYLRAQNDVTGCWSVGSGSLAVVITPPLATISGTPGPTNAATGICYAGVGAVSSISWSAAAGATSYDVYFGAGSLPGAITANVLAPTVTFSTGTLQANTTYYWKIVPKNACGITTGTPSNWSFTTASAPCYCTSSGSTFPNGITGVNFNSINNLGTSVNTAYTNFTAISTTVVKGFPYNLNIFLNTGGNYTDRQSVYIDWNGNGSFADAGEFYNLGTATNVTNGLSSLSPLSITIPVGAITGSVRMRVQSRYNSATGDPCLTGFDGEVEDYTIIITDPVPCVAPTAQPTSLALTSNGSTINGAFTAASPVPNNYLVVVNTTGVAPLPTNGTTYTIGSTALGGTNVVVDNDSNTSFSATLLTPFTTYYFFVYAMNNYCSGGPFYLSTSPLTGNAVANYCIPTVDNTHQTSTNNHIRKVEFIGTLQDIVNTSTFPTVAPFGYSDFTGLATKAKQAKGGVVNIYVESPNSGFIKAWVDWNKDGDFSDLGESIYDAGGTSQASTTLGFIVPTSIAAGDYRVRIRISGYNGAGADAGFNWGACDTNLAYFGETEDYLLTVIEDCNAKITTITNGSVCGIGSVTLLATATAGTTEFRWYSSQTGGALLGTTTTGTWNTPSISSTTTYWVTAYNGSCETLARSKVKAIVKSAPTLTFASSNIEICGEESVALTAGGDTETIYLIDENFESGLGVFSNNHITNNPAVNTTTAWQIKTGPYVPTGTTWFPAISSNFGTNNFAFVNSDIGTRPCGSPPCYYTINNALVSNAVNSTGFLDLTLKFRIYFDRYFPNTTYPNDELMQVEVSTNGTVWTSVSGNLINDIGYGGVFSDLSYNLIAYINQPTLSVRIRYYTTTWANGAAVDDVELFGNKPLLPNFTWTSAFPIDAYTDLSCTIPYTAGTPATTVYIKPTLAQLENANFSFTANANLANGCVSSGTINVTNKSSIWKGTISNDWNNPNNWLPVGIPTINTCVIIPDVTSTNPSKVLGTNYNGFGKTLQVKNLGNLQIQPTNTLTIADNVTVNSGGTFNIENSGSLIQINNVANIGNISMKRNTNIKKLDYVYWSTPVANFASSAISPLTSTNLIYKWEPTTITSFASNFGNWVNGNETMINGKGYIVRGPNNFLATPQIYTANFIGIPNNGIITTPISRSNYTSGTYTTGPTSTPVTNDDDNWNLVGNPYPSAINADAFLNTNSTKIASWIEIWTHGTAPSTAIADPFYQDFGYNYTVSDYLRYNALGGTQFGFDGKIGAGQSFMVLMKDAAITPNTLEFNNAMRSNTYRNDQFYRTTESISVEKHRIWLQLISPQGLESKSLVGYATEATNTYDPMFDADNSGVKTTFELYSVLDTKGLSIQGRALPFDDTDQVSLGVTIPQNGNYIIAIAAVDGLFTSNNQDIYLEDQLLNITHNLRVNPYSFSATTGKYENRFILKYTNSTLSTNDFTANEIKVYTNESINVITTNQTIKSVRVYDILGRVLGNFDNINTSTFSTTTIANTQTTLLVEVELDNGFKKSYKVIF